MSPRRKSLGPSAGDSVQRFIRLTFFLHLSSCRMSPVRSPSLVFNLVLCPWACFAGGRGGERQEGGGGLQEPPGRALCSGGGGGRIWHKASVSDCLPLAAPIGLSPLHIQTLCGPERVLVVSPEPPDDLSCLTTPGLGRPGDGAVARAVDQGHPDAHSGGGGGGLPTPALTCVCLRDHCPDRGFSQLQWGRGGPGKGAPWIWLRTAYAAPGAPGLEARTARGRERRGEDWLL